MKKTNLFKAVALAAVLLAGTLIGCKNGTTEAAGPKGQIFGFVLDTKGEPVEGATVALGGKTTKTNAEGAFVLSGIPINDNGSVSTTAGSGANDLALDGNRYKVVVTKKGYLSKTSNEIIVKETTEETDAAHFLKEVVDAGQKAILTAYATQVSNQTNNTTAANGAMAISPDGTIIVTKDDDDTFKKLADTYAKEFDAYKSIAKAYESTFVTIALTPANAYYSGVIKTTKSAAKDTVTDAASIKAAPKGVKVKLTTANTTVSGTGTNTTGYVFEATTDKEGKFEFENLPVGIPLTLKVEGFESDGNYYSFINGVGGATIYDYAGVPTQENTNAIAATTTTATNNGTTTVTITNSNTITLEEKSGPKNKVEILLYAQPAKIIVTETNLLENTEVAPLALDTAITVKFNKAMDYVELVSATGTGVNNVAELGTDAAYAWDDAKTTVTITPKDGYWTAAGEKVTFKLAGRAQDGATEFIDGEFIVKLDNVIKVKFENTTTVDAAAVAATDTEPAKDAVVGKDSFKLTFDRPLDANIAKDFYITDDKSESLTLTWSETADKLPVVTVEARDGKFGTAGNHKFTLNNLKAKDGSTTYVSYDPEYEAANANAAPAVTQGFKVRFGGFYVTGISLVTKAEGDRARTIIGYTSDYLKITFNKNVGKIAAGFDVKDNATTPNKSKDIFIKDNAIYASLADFADETGITITGKVYSVDADEFNAGTGANNDPWDADLQRMIANYLIRKAYVIVDSNLVGEVKSINAGNDNTVPSIKATDAITLTFNKAFPTGTTFETELYIDKGTNADLELVNQTKYSATAAADTTGKIVTVTPATTHKIEAGKKYYLSLKAKSADGAVLFTTKSPSFGAVATVYGVNVEQAIRGQKTKSNVAYNYITFTTEAVKLLTAENAKTTDPVEFAKSANSAIVLQFNQAVTGYSAYLYNPTSYLADTDGDTNPDVNNWPTKKANILNADWGKTYASTFVVADDLITITPTYSFASETKPAIAVYDAEGDLVQLSTATNPPLAYQPYTSKKLTTANEIVANAAKATITDLSVTNPTEINTGVAGKIKFKFVANTYGNTLPSFVLYKKVARDDGGEAEWVTANMTGNTQTALALKVEDETTYTYRDWKIGKEFAYVTLAGTDTDVTFGNEKFVILTTIDNEVVKSEEFELADNLCTTPTVTWALPATAITTELTQETLLATVTAGTEYLTALDVTSDMTGLTFTKKRNTNGGYSIYLPKGAKIDAGKKVTISGAKDFSGKLPEQIQDPADATKKIPWQEVRTFN